MASGSTLRRESADPADDRPRAGQRAATPAEPSAGSGGGGLTRVTVNLNRQAVSALEAIGEATGYSKTDAINRALQIYAIVQELMDRSGGVLQITHANGDVERVHII
jgi:hypothetical protein